MSKQKKQLRRTSALIRPGEGHAIQIVRRETPKPDGTTALEIGLDVGNAPVPERHYFAEVASVRSVGDALYLMFGQRAIGPNGPLRSVITLVLAPEATSNFLGTCGDFALNVERYLTRISAPKARLVEISEEPSQAVVMVANVVAASHVGREACMDFYHASPRAIRDVMQHEKDVMAIDPVVRIQLFTTLLAGVLDGIKAAHSSLPIEVDQ